jgi:hypothetical protein
MPSLPFLPCHEERSASVETYTRRHAALGGRLNGGLFETNSSTSRNPGFRHPSVFKSVFQESYQ